MPLLGRQHPAAIHRQARRSARAGMELPQAATTSLTLCRSGLSCSLRNHQGASRGKWTQALQAADTASGQHFHPREPSHQQGVRRGTTRQAQDVHTVSFPTGQTPGYTRHHRQRKLTSYCHRRPHGWSPSRAAERKQQTREDRVNGSIRFSSKPGKEVGPGTTSAGQGEVTGKGQRDSLESGPQCSTSPPRMVT